MRFDLEQFEKRAAWFYDFCRRLEKSGLPNMPRDDHDGLLAVNLHLQIALEALKQTTLEVSE
jgi:hypothetical protein